MRDLSTFRFEPKSQPKDGPRVAFTLLPLDQRGAWTLTASMRANDGFPGWEAVEHVATRCIVGWEGIDPAYSREALASVLEAQADPRWQAWLVEIVGTLYRRSLLGEDERKN